MKGRDGGETGKKWSRSFRTVFLRKWLGYKGKVGLKKGIPDREKMNAIRFLLTRKFMYVSDWQQIYIPNKWLSMVQNKINEWMILKEVLSFTA